jgi:rhodanese-related sulfurtransferase
MGSKAGMTFVKSKHKEQFGRRRTRRIFILFYSLISLLGLPYMAMGDTEMSDAKKKEAVYRMYAEYKKDFPEVRDISPQQAMEWLRQDRVVFVDTRKPAEMAVSMLPGAVSQQDFLNNPDQYKDKTPVAYCTISYRSGVFAHEMAEKRVTVVNLEGGLLAWILEGGKVYDQSGKEVKRAHVYGDKWNLAPADYEIVKFSLWEQIF